MYHDNDSYDDVLTVKGKRAKSIAYLPTTTKPKHKKLAPYKRERVQDYSLEEDAANLIPFWEEAEEEPLKPLMEEIAGLDLIRVCLHGPYRQTFVFWGENENYYLSYDPREGWEICFIPF